MYRFKIRENCYLRKLFIAFSFGSIRFTSVSKLCMKFEDFLFPTVGREHLFSSLYHGVCMMFLLCIACSIKDERTKKDSYRHYIFLSHVESKMGRLSACVLHSSGCGKIEQCGVKKIVAKCRGLNCN